MDELKNEQNAATDAASGANTETTQDHAKKPGVQDVNGDGKVDFKDYLAAAAKAAGEACQSAADTVKEKAPEFAQKAKDAAGNVKDAFVEVAETVKEKSPEYVQKVKDAAGNVKEAFEDAFCHKTPEPPKENPAAAEPPASDDSPTRI